MLLIACVANCTYDHPVEEKIILEDHFVEDHLRRLSWTILGCQTTIYIKYSGIKQIISHHLKIYFLREYLS